MKSKISGKEVLRYFWKKSLKEKKLLIFIVIGGMGALLCSLYLPILYANIIDAITDNINEEKVQVLHVLFGIILTIAGVEVFSMLSRRLVGFSIIPFEIKGMRRIFAESFNYLHRHSYRFFTNNFGGALVKKVNKLAYSYEKVMDIFVFNLLRLAIYLPLILIIIFTRNWKLGVISTSFVAVYTVFQFFAYKSNLTNELESNKQDSSITGNLADTITNNFNVLTFASQKREARSFGKILSSREYIKKKTRKKGEYIRMVSDILMVIYELVIIYIGVKLWSEGMISTGTIVLLQAYTLKIFDQMFHLGYVFKGFNTSIGESAEMLEILKTPHEVQDKKNAKIFKAASGQISFEDISFSYNPGVEIFNKLSFSIKPGEKVALVGESGSGKTTIIKLLMRFFDINKGAIKIDDQDISKLKQDSLRDAISIVPQDPILFHRSLRENIAYGNITATEKEIIAASKMARCHRFIKKLPDGYATLVGERGIKLSGGERQRVAIARAILENKQILILDEATSSLDSESELLIQEAMEALIRKKTAIIVAHRLSTIINMDRIIVMDQGKIAEMGTHKELLLSKNGIYKKLWNIQSGGFIS